MKIINQIGKTAKVAAETTLNDIRVVDMWDEVSNMARPVIDRSKQAAPKYVTRELFAPHRTVVTLVSCEQFNEKVICVSPVHNMSMGISLTGMRWRDELVSGNIACGKPVTIHELFTQRGTRLYDLLATKKIGGESQAYVVRVKEYNESTEITLRYDIVGHIRTTRKREQVTFKFVVTEVTGNVLHVYAKFTTGQEFETGQAYNHVGYAAT